ncbi:hypothetical protein [Massilia cavernae]|uniref:Uncharacterized protein n=1 Tax=Massilia cavernae TaxID=2320864 RepID=A0A418XG60_9BURK|nr:hypothetical protein [Massilia cavernae]RJG11437.1 hypothetical protein D3872_19800 [Massilia cavernae]
MKTLLTSPAETPTPEAISETDFFENVPPGQAKEVTLLQVDQGGLQNAYATWGPKDLRLYCTSEQCAGYRFFQHVGECQYRKKGLTTMFATFRCRNCNNHRKQYAISVRPTTDDKVEMFKYGELPQFGPPNPSKVLSLMGAERDAYLKGRRCENQGLGVGAFAYYRRVVENQKSKIIGEILKVAEKLDAAPELIEDLRAAKQETRFTEALNRIKHGLPPILLIDGHNPLTLLHSALSEGLHATSDEACLELATSIRVVLTELVERMATAVKEEAELTSAVQRLLKVGGKR